MHTDQVIVNSGRKKPHGVNLSPTRISIRKLTLMCTYFLFRVLIPNGRYKGQKLKKLVKMKIPAMTSSIIASIPEITCVKYRTITIDQGDGRTEVSAINPVASMMVIQNNDLESIALEITEKLKRVIESL